MKTDINVFKFISKGRMNHRFLQKTHKDKNLIEIYTLVILWWFHKKTGPR